MREGFALTGIHTKRELIHTALQELIRKHTKKDLTDLAGKIQLQDDYDHKKLRDADFVTIATIRPLNHLKL